MEKNTPTSNTRREFIKQVAITGLVAAWMNPFKAIFAGVASSNMWPPWAELVEYARWCPSVHNLQPHRIRIISATEAELYYDPAKLLPVGDPQAIFTTIAMGIFVEHMAIAASSYQATVDITEVFEPITTSASQVTLFAKLTLARIPRKEELTRDLMLKRRTSRLHYDGKPLRESTLEKIKAQANALGHQFNSTREKAMVDFIIDLNQQTLFEDLASKADREELDHLFRYTQEEAAEKKDGLWAKCMGFPGGLMKSVFRHHEKWEKGLLKKMLAADYKASFKGTATICWFSGKFENTQDWLQAGKMLARNWLRITSEGAYIQPFGSLITNVSAYAKINERLEKPKEGEKIWMIFRAGYSKEPARSYRLETNQIILT